MPKSPASSENSIWPYGLIAFFIVFIGWTAFRVSLAVRNDVDLVRDDYYAAEVRYQDQIEREKSTAQLGSAAAVQYEGVLHQLRVRIPAEHMAPDTTGQIRFYRPSDDTLDHAFDLKPAGDGKQVLDTAHLQSGLWRVRVEWTAGGREYFKTEPIVVPGNPAS